MQPCGGVLPDLPAKHPLHANTCTDANRVGSVTSRERPDSLTRKKYSRIWWAEMEQEWDADRECRAQVSACA